MFIVFVKSGAGVGGECDLQILAELLISPGSSESGALSLLNRLGPLKAPCPEPSRITGACMGLTSLLTQHALCSLTPAKSLAFRWGRGAGFDR